MSKRDLSRVLGEEDRARRFAERIVELCEAGDDEERIGREVEGFLAYLTDDLEIHLQHEETDLFPALAARGLDVETQEARHQHEQLRTLRRALFGVPRHDAKALHDAALALALALIRHTAFEKDFLYVDLTQDEARAFREGVDGDRHVPGLPRSGT